MSLGKMQISVKCLSANKKIKGIVLSVPLHLAPFLAASLTSVSTDLF